MGVVATDILGVWGLTLALFVTGDLPVVRIVGLPTAGFSVVALLRSLRGIVDRLQTR